MKALTIKYSVNRHQKTLSLPSTLKVKRSYFVILLSNEKNLDLCIKHKLAGFPYTKNGEWAFNDIEVGDFVSFFYNGQLINLYEVVEKMDLRNNPQYTNFLLSDAKEDPVPLNNSNDRWLAIKAKKGNIGFPYRLRLKLIKDYEEVIFKPEFLNLGYNILPRTTYGKTHFQGHLSSCYTIFDLKPEEFSSYIQVNPQRYFFEFKFTSEFTLQILLKRLLNVLIPKDADLQKLFNIQDLNSIEILSEQKMKNGEADLVIYSSKNKVIIIEVKYQRITKKDGQLSAYGKKAAEQVLSYKSISDKPEIMTKAIAGYTNYDKHDIVFKEMKFNNERIITIEVKAAQTKRQAFTSY